MKTLNSINLFIIPAIYILPFDNDTEITAKEILYCPLASLQPN